MKSMTIMFYQSKTFLQRYIRHIQSSTPNLTICSLVSDCIWSGWVHSNRTEPPTCIYFYVTYNTIYYFITSIHLLYTRAHTLMHDRLKQHEIKIASIAQNSVSNCSSQMKYAPRSLCCFHFSHRLVWTFLVVGKHKLNSYSNTHWHCKRKHIYK